MKIFSSGELSDLDRNTSYVDLTVRVKHQLYQDWESFILTFYQVTFSILGLLFQKLLYVSQ